MGVAVSKEARSYARQSVAFALDCVFRPPSGDGSYNQSVSVIN